MFMLLGSRGQTGSFPPLKISNHYEPTETCQTNIRKRSVCPRFPENVPSVPDFQKTFRLSPISRKRSVCPRFPVCPPIPPDSRRIVVRLLLLAQLKGNIALFPA